MEKNTPENIKQKKAHETKPISDKVNLKRRHYRY